MTNSGDIFAQARGLGVKTVRLMVYQPKAGGAREWVCDLDYLERFAAKLRSKAASVEVAAREYGRMKGSPETEAEWADIFLNPTPNEDECAFCKAMAICPNAAAKVETAVGVAPTSDAFTDLAADSGVHAKVVAQAAAADDLAGKMLAVPFLEDWCLAVRAEVERRLLEGAVVPGFGLELGRAGPRKWADSVAAEKVLREQFRLTIEEAYNLKLKSPTQMEELAPKVDKKTGKPLPPKEGDPKPALGPRQWNKLQELIVRSDAKPSVKPSKVIKKPYTVAAASAFSAVTETPSADEDLG